MKIAISNLEEFLLYFKTFLKQAMPNIIHSLTLIMFIFCLGILWLFSVEVKRSFLEYQANKQTHQQKEK